MSGHDDWRRWLVPGVFPMTILEIAADQGHDRPDLLMRAGLGVGATTWIDRGLPLERYVRLMEVVDEALGDPALGLELGWRLPPTALGSVGHALIACATVGDALALLQRFWHLAGRATTIRVDTSTEIGSLELAFRLPMSEAQRAMVMEVSLAAVYRGVSALVPEARDATEVWFDFAEPVHAARVRARLGEVRYGMPSCQLRFPCTMLSTRLSMANAVALKAAVAECEREQRERGLTEERLTERVVSELRPGPDGYPALGEIARRMAMATRTLRRHLAREGTGFAALLDDARRRDAVRLLDNPALPAHEVAAMLGYRDPANFTRAFRRWTGRTPTQFRREPRPRGG